MEGPGGQVMCPVCTLYLRPNMTLHDHLFTHPKDQVIEALVRLAVTPTSPAIVNTNSQFTAITYRQFQTLSTNVPEPLMLNPCLVTNSAPTFTSGVIRSSVPLLSYPYYPPEHPPPTTFSDQNRADSNTQCSYSYVAQTTQTTQTSSPQVVNDSPFHEASCETVQEVEEENENYEPAVDPFLNERTDNHSDNPGDSFSSTNIKNIHGPPSRLYTGPNSNNVHKSTACPSLNNIDEQGDDNFQNAHDREDAIDSLVKESVNNIHETKLDTFENGEMENCVHESTLDMFVNERIRNVSDDTMTNNVEVLHNDSRTDHMEKMLHQVETNDTSFIPKSPCLGTVISNTHRLIANDPSLDYDQDLRTEDVEDYAENDYGNVSPNRTIHSPASDVSNWSTGSGLRVRRDLSNLDDQGSSCVQYVQPNSNASEYVTSDPYNDQETEGQLTNLDAVNYSMVLNYSTNQTLVDMNVDDIEGKDAPLNIHSDELMPPRGELSGQESLGATENSVWDLDVSTPIKYFTYLSFVLCLF